MTISLHQLIRTLNYVTRADPISPWNSVVANQALRWGILQLESIMSVNENTIITNVDWILIEQNVVKKGNKRKKNITKWISQTETNFAVWKLLIDSICRQLRRPDRAPRQFIKPFILIAVPTHLRHSRTVVKATRSSKQMTSDMLSISVRNSSLIKQ